GIRDLIVTGVQTCALPIYVAFQAVVLAALVARLRGWTSSGAYRLGRWGLPVNIMALGYGVAAAINLAWPRAAVGAAWYDRWVVLLGLAVVLGVGLGYMVLGRPYRRGTTPAGDATMIRGEDSSGASRPPEPVL